MDDSTINQSVPLGNQERATTNSDKPNAARQRAVLGIKAKLFLAFISMAASHLVTLSDLAALGHHHPNHLFHA